MTKKRKDGSVSLERHIKALMKEQELRQRERAKSDRRSIRSAQLAVEKADEKLEAATASKFASGNEFRATIEDISRSRASQEGLDTLSARVTDNSSRLRSNDDRKSGLSAGWGYLLGALSLASLLVSLYLNLKN